VREEWDWGEEIRGRREMRKSESVAGGLGETGRWGEQSEGGVGSVENQ